MKEGPILFSTALVPPVLADTKTQTRRTCGLKRFNVAPDEWRYQGEFELGMHRMVHIETGEVVEIRSPYGTAGTRRWVREAWLPARHGSYEPIPRGDKWVDLKSKWSCSVAYRADYRYGSDDYDGHWRPSIHMPRWASRINLDVLVVRMERLQDISEADAIAEGCALNDRGWYSVNGLVLNGRSLMFQTARECLRALWKFINGKDSLAANPWVWVVEFRRCA